MTLLLLLASWFGAHVDGEVRLLGHDEFEVREAAEARLNHWLPALFLPPASDDPEVNHRLRGLRTRNARLFGAEFIERVVYRGDYGLWLDRWFIPGRHRIAIEDVYHDLTGDARRMWDLHERWAAPWSFWEGGPWLAQTNLAEFREWCDYNRHTAPAPRAVGP